MSGAYSRTSGLTQRRSAAVTNSASEGSNNDEEDKLNDREAEDHDSKETRLTLMEEILLLGLKDREVIIHRL